MEQENVTKYIRFISNTSTNITYNFLLLNTILIITALFLILLLWHLEHSILRPFESLNDMAIALSKGDYTMRLKEHKSKYFGRFLWGLDMMREELQYHYQKEMELMKEKKTLIASMSHDMKTPLSNIRLYSEASRTGLYPSEKTMIKIQENAAKIENYINEIIQSSTQELFDFQVHPEDHYIKEIVDDILNPHIELMNLRKIQYHIHPFSNKLVCIDMDKLKEVIDNLIDNAVKYGDQNQISISFYEEDYHTIIKITNTGTPIDSKDSSSIFQSFYRGNNIRKQKGNGLGLYICKEYMKAMKGDIFFTQEDHEVSFHLVLI